MLSLSNSLLLNSLAISSIFFNLWFTPDLLIGGSNNSPNSFNVKSSLKKLIIPKNVTSIGYGAFSNSNSELKIYFEIDKELSSWDKDWNDNGSTLFTNYYLYSENEPTSIGNYWHYVNNVVTEW